VKNRLSEQKPIVIYICDEEDEKSEKALDSKVFCNEKIGLAMKRFTCLKGAIQSIPDERLAEKIARQTPSFHFFDPAGKPIKVLKGRQATSCSAFSGRVQALWDSSFVMKLKDYTKRMGKILDQMDKLEAEKARLTDKMDRAADNPGKLLRLQKEQEELTAEEASIGEEEQELLKGVALKPEFLPEGSESVQR
jgi:hypothetical protein